MGSIIIGLTIILIIAITGEIAVYKEQKRKRDLFELYYGKTM